MYPGFFYCRCTACISSSRFRSMFVRMRCIYRELCLSISFGCSEKEGACYFCSHADIQTCPMCFRALWIQSSKQKNVWGVTQNSCWIIAWNVATCNSSSSERHLPSPFLQFPCPWSKNEDIHVHPELPPINVKQS